MTSVGVSLTRPSLQWFRSKLVETRAGSLDSTKVPRILNGTGSRTRAYLVEKGYQTATASSPVSRIHFLGVRVKGGGEV